MLTSRNSKESSHKPLADKINRLLDSGRKNCLTIEIDKKRYCGQLMDYITLTDKDISFGYHGEDFSLIFENMRMMRRLRSRKYLLVFTPEKIKIEKNEEKKSPEKVSKKITKKKVTKK